MKRILLVEDDETLAKGVALSLRSGDVAVTMSHTLEAADKLLQVESFDLLLLDINLPDGSGLDFCKKIKARNQLPIILLTARDLEMDIVTGFGYGADDYVTKPFSLAVLRARVESLLNRYAKLSVPDQGFQFGQTSFDFSEQRFMVGQEMLEFSKIEQRVLKIFLANIGITLTRETLSANAWELEADFVDENALSVVIKRLRTKLASSQDVEIKTVYGIGYRMEVGDG